MSTDDWRANAPAWGRLIDDAREGLRPALSQNKAAEMAGISGTRWRAIVKGEAGEMTTARGIERVALMAKAAQVRPEQLEAVGRTDVALELRLLIRPTEEEIEALAGLTDEGRASAQRLREYIDRLVEEREEDKLRTTERVVRAIVGDEQAG